MAVIVLVVVVVAAVTVNFLMQTATTPSTSITSAASTASTAPSNELVIDDAYMCDWTLGAFTCSNWWQDTVYQTLVAINVTAEGQGVIQMLPMLATSWTVSPDGMTYTFPLRQNVSFSNGNPFNAYVVWTDFYMQYYMFGSASNFVFGLSLFNFKNVKFGPDTLALIKQSGTSPSQDLLSIMQDSSWPVYVKDQNTIVFQLIVPFTGFLPLLLPVYVLGIFDPAYVMEHGGPGAPGSPNPYFPTHLPPGTGPYMISNIIEYSRMVFVKNPNYWGRNLTPSEVAANPSLDPGHFEKITINVVPDISVRYLDITSNRAQMASLYGSAFSLIVKSNDPKYGWVQFGDYSAIMIFMAMNVHKPPTNIPGVRQAIIHAINVTEIIDQAVYGYGAPYVGPETPNYGKYYNPGNLPPYDYNVTKAAEYLAKAGFPNGKGLPPIKLQIDDLQPWEQITAELIQKDLAVIGLTVNIEVITFPHFESLYMAPYSQLLNNTEVANMVFDSGNAYSPDYIGIADYLGQFTTNSSSFGNFATYSSDATNRALMLALSSNNETAIVQAMKDAYQQIYNDAPYFWIMSCKLPLGGGSIVYNTDVVHTYKNEPMLYGGEDLPLLNTVA